MTATTATAIQNQTHGEMELLLAAGDGATVALGVTDGWTGTTAPDEVLVGVALLAGLEAGLLLMVGRAVVAGADVAVGGDEAAELRVAVRLETTPPTADDTLLPVAPHPATSQAATMTKPANPAHLSLTVDPPRACLR